MSSVEKKNVQEFVQMHRRLNPVSESQAVVATAMRIIKEDIDWQQEAVAALATELGVEVDDIKTTDVDAHSFMAENGKEEYLVYRDEDAAEAAAIAQVKEMLDDMPDSFNQDWLQSFLTVSDTDIHIIAGEQADSYADDIDDDRALEEAKMKGDYDELSDERDDIESKLSDLEDEEDPDENKVSELGERIAELDKQMGDKVEEARQSLKDDIIKTWEEGLGNNPIDFLVNDQGLYSREDALKASFIQIDTDAAAEDAVNVDGIGHFLAGYDGSQIDLIGDFVAYRTN